METWNVNVASHVYLRVYTIIVLYAVAVGEWRAKAAMGSWPRLRGCSRGRSMERRAGSRQPSRAARLSAYRVR